MTEPRRSDRRPAQAVLVAYASCMEALFIDALAAMFIVGTLVSLLHEKRERGRATQTTRAVVSPDCRLTTTEVLLASAVLEEVHDDDDDDDDDDDET